MITALTQVVRQQNQTSKTRHINLHIHRWFATLVSTNTVSKNNQTTLNTIGDSGMENETID